MREYVFFESLKSISFKNRLAENETILNSVATGCVKFTASNIITDPHDDEVEKRQE